MRYEIPYEQISSEKNQDELVPNEWVTEEVQLIRRRGEEYLKPKKQSNRYLLKNIINEFQSTTLDNADSMSIVENRLNRLLEDKLNGKPIPSYGFVLNTTTKMWEYVHPPEPRTGYDFLHVYTPTTLKLEYNFPNDRTVESCLRQIVGKDEHHTVFFQIPFRLLSKRVSNHNQKPVRNYHWVYRIRFILKDEERYKQKLNRYYRGYIGATSQHNVIYRFSQHFRCYKSDATNEIYKAWRELRDNSIEHILIVEVLERCRTHEEAFARESELIKAEGTFMPYGLNMTLGGEDGLRQCKACGINANLENKDDLFADYVESKQKKHITPVRPHIRRYDNGLVTSVKGHWRCYTDKGRSILIDLGVSESDIAFDID